MNGVSEEQPKPMSTLNHAHASLPSDLKRDCSFVRGASVRAS